MQIQTELGPQNITLSVRKTVQFLEEPWKPLISPSGQAKTNGDLMFWEK